MKISWPGGARFAFSVFDDTDFSTLENTKPVYDLLRDCGFRTTKSCWVRNQSPGQTSTNPGMTVEDPLYLSWLLFLSRYGFEVGLHNVCCGPSTRAQTIAGFARFEMLFGHSPHCLANHVGVREAIYWGDYRVGGARRLAYNCLTLCRNAGVYDGHIEGSQGFWGDLCRQKVKYVRNFTFRDVNTLRACPFMPYHDPARPYVNYWFSSTDGDNLTHFTMALCEEAQDRLEEEGGACIMYTHFASGFYAGNELNARFAELMRRLARKKGWFVPVVQLLNHIGQQQGYHVLAPPERRAIEWKWLWDKISTGRT